MSPPPIGADTQGLPKGGIGQIPLQTPWMQTSLDADLLDADPPGHVTLMHTEKSTPLPPCEQNDRQV